MRKCERSRPKTYCGWLWDDGVVADVDHVDDDLIDVDVVDGDELLDHSVLHKAWGIYGATGHDKVVIAGNRCGQTCQRLVYSELDLGGTIHSSCGLVAQNCKKMTKSAWWNNDAIATGTQLNSHILL